MGSHQNKSKEQSSLDSHNDIMTVMDASIQGVRGVVDVMYSKFETTSQKAHALTTGMPHLMERLLRANMNIVSTFKPAGNGNVHMSLMIHNKTQFAITAMTGVLEFGNKEIDIVYQKAHYQHDEKETLPNVFTMPCNLAPQTCYKQDIEIHIKEPKHCNGAITLNIQHPLLHPEGIVIRHVFGLYLIDQLRKEILDNNNKSSSIKADLALVDTLCYPVAFFRDIFKIQAIKGINSDMCVALSSPKYKIVCEIMSVTEDMDYVDVAFHSNHPALAEQLMDELGILSSN